MNKTLLLLGLPSALVAGLLTAGATGASAAGPGFVDETTRDCRDVAETSGGSYQRLVDTITAQPGTLPGTYSGYTVSLLPRGVVQLDASLHAPSCAEVTYTLNVYQLEYRDNVPYAGALIGTSSVPGNGAQKLRLQAVVTAAGVTKDDPKLDAFFQVVTSDRRGAADYAPDVLGSDGSAVTAKVDGTSGGGAVSSFK